MNKAYIFLIIFFVGFQNYFFLYMNKQTHMFVMCI